MGNENNCGKFVKIKATAIDDIINGKVLEIPESDLSIQNDTHIVQFKHVDNEQEYHKTIVKPGCFLLQETMQGVKPIKFELKTCELLKSVDNTKIIMNEADKFFSRLHIFAEIPERPIKRGILLCSKPGVGKTASINEVCKQFLTSGEEDTAILIWDTSAVRSSSINKFFMTGAKYNKNVKKIIFVIEDIGGGSVEESYGHRTAESSLLNLLDGVGNPFNSIPTFIIATTNNPETAVEPLIDRPGRFDKVLELPTPNKTECADLFKFFTKQEILDNNGIEAAELAAENGFSIAHLQECVIRAKLDDVTILEAAQQLVTHKERYKNGFQEKKNLGFMEE